MPRSAPVDDASRPDGLRAVGDTRDVLGEGPIWCRREQALYWVDIRGQAVRRHDPRAGCTESWPMPEPVGSLALRRSGGLLVALRSGLAWFDPRTGVLQPAFRPDGHGAPMRFNDGRCDPQGRFWVGSLNDTARVPDGRLYRIEPTGRCTAVLDGITIPNSLCWSPDGRTMYFADSWIHTLWAFPFDPRTGELGPRRVVARTTPPGVPDGAAVDEQGFVWFAEHDGWRVVRVSPDGDVARVIPLPVQLPTACAFGGPELDTLYITTKTYGLTADVLAGQPLAGALLALDVGVRGLPEPLFDA